MQRLHENDVAGMIIKSNMNYEVINIPAEITEKVNPYELRERYIDGLFFPKAFNKEMLEDAKKSLGTLQYAGQYLQQPAPAEGNMIKAKWFKTFTATEELLKLPRNFRSDTAYGKEGSDNTATICYSIFKGQLFIWNVWKANLGFPDFIKAYVQYVKANGYTSSSRCYFEPKATGISVIQTLRTESHLNVLEGESPKESKETRVSSASPSIEAGKVLLLNYSDWIDGFITEAGMFPNAEHDDALDVLTAIINEELRDEPLVVSFI
jgi:predicted phage terminase large subunit-like protein